MQQTQEAAVAPALASALINAVTYAGEQLSGLIECPIRLIGTHVERLRLERLPGLIEGEDRLVTAIYLAFSGPFEGHVVLSFSPDAAAELASRLLMEPVDGSCELDEMAQSALGEIGNITTSAFLTSIANAFQYAVHPSPPVVVQDMIGALLSNVVVELALESTHALLVHTVFEVDGEAVQGELMLLPTNQSCDSLESRLASCK